MLQEAWQAMEAEMSDYQVVGFRQECRVELVERKKSKRLTGIAKECFGYHAFSNPASRRTGAQEFAVLVTDIRSGSLWRAFADLAKEWQIKPTYARSEQVLAGHGIKLWGGHGAKYGRLRL